MDLTRKSGGRSAAWHTHLACAASFAAPFALGADPAAAQEEDRSAGLEEITITAQFRRENMQVIPIAITAITGDALAERGQTNLVQLAAQAPNVDIQPAAAGYGAAAVVSIRGISQ